MYEDLFYRRLTALRVKKGVSARDMSLSLGQSESYINKIENRKALPGMHAFFYICEYLGVTPSQFFDEETENPKLLDEVLAELKQLDDTSLQGMLTVARGMKKKQR